MKKKDYFTLSFRKKRYYITTLREQIYKANTIEEREKAIPKWMILMLIEFERKHSYTNIASLLLGSLLITTSYTMDEEFVCILDEIESEVLQLTIQQMEKNIDFSWTSRYQNKDY